MNDNARDLLGGIVSDIVGAFLPVSGVAAAGWEALMRRRLRRAADIAIEALRRGEINTSMLDPEDLVAMLFRYLRAAQEGTARLNLRLMADVIAGEQKARTLTADEFLYHAAILSSLTREEIILLATIYRHYQSEQRETDQVLRNSRAIDAAMKEMIPAIIDSKEEFTATMAALTRTGLLIPGSSFGSIVYRVSPMLTRLYALAPFEAALQREADDTAEPSLP